MYEHDVIVVGAGGAGLRAAIAANEAGPIRPSFRNSIQFAVTLARPKAGSTPRFGRATTGNSTPTTR